MTLHLNPNPKDKHSSKPAVERLEQEKQEYKPLGRYLRTPGLKLFAYNPQDRSIAEVEMRDNRAIELRPTDNGLEVPDATVDEATVDSRNIHFEALNMRNAQKRVHRFYSGRISELCNLREPGRIDIYA